MSEFVLVLQVHVELEVVELPHSLLGFLMLPHLVLLLSMLLFLSLTHPIESLVLPFLLSLPASIGVLLNPP
jgi:hypothetical protein